MTIFDTPLIQVPNLVGMSKMDIMDQMVNLKIDSSGTGDVVVRQSPDPGTKVKAGSTIRLYFDKGS